MIPSQYAFTPPQVVVAATKLKKSVAVSEENVQERSRRRPGAADFPAAVFLARKCPNLGRAAGIACRAAGKSGKKFLAALKFAGKRK